MARLPRKELIAEDEVGLYHCVQRCVRRAWLCGKDPLTGKDYEHRKLWIRKRLEFLAGQFGIEVCSFAVMVNHLHVILRNRPDAVASWSDDDVARRWWNLFPKRRDQDGNPAEPEPHELDMLVADGEVLAERRRRLSSLSWFMRCLAEPIARQANREDGCTGRFWEGRYKCQRLLDESAVLACSVYVDLNPIRAGAAQTPETSEFTSVYERIHAGEVAGEVAQWKAEEKRAGASKGARDELVAGDQWLSPIELERDGARDVKPSRHRASDKGFLPLKVHEYLEILDWTGREARKKKRGTIPAELAPILERLRISGETWVDMVTNFGRWFRRAAGRVESLREEAHRRGRHWLHGVTHSRAAFV